MKNISTKQSNDSLLKNFALLNRSFDLVRCLALYHARVNPTHPDLRRELFKIQSYMTVYLRNRGSKSLVAMVKATRADVIQYFAQGEGKITTFPVSLWMKRRKDGIPS